MKARTPLPKWITAAFVGSLIGLFVSVGVGIQAGAHWRWSNLHLQAPPVFSQYKQDSSQSHSEAVAKAFFLRDLTALDRTHELMDSAELFVIEQKFLESMPTTVSLGAFIAVFFALVVARNWRQRFPWLLLPEPANRHQAYFWQALLLIIGLLLTNITFADYFVMGFMQVIGYLMFLIAGSWFGHTRRTVIRRDDDVTAAVFESWRKRRPPSQSP